MNRLKLLAMVLAATALFWTYLNSSNGQRSRRSRPTGAPNSNMQLRLTALEQRVLVLETILSVSATPVSQTEALQERTVEQWEQDLSMAERRLEHSSRMARKGYLNKFALFEDQMAVQRAKRQLAIAQGDPPRATLAELELAVVQAERDVAAVNADLKLTQVQTRYGVGASTNYKSRINALRENSKEAQQLLEQAKEALRTFQTSSQTGAEVQNETQP